MSLSYYTRLLLYNTSSLLAYHTTRASSYIPCRAVSLLYHNRLFPHNPPQWVTSAKQTCFADSKSNTNTSSLSPVIRIILRAFARPLTCHPAIVIIVNNRVASDPVSWFSLTHSPLRHRYFLTHNGNPEELSWGFSQASKSQLEKSHRSKGKGHTGHRQ